MQSACNTWHKYCVNLIFLTFFVSCNPYVESAVAISIHGIRNRLRVTKELSQNYIASKQEDSNQIHMCFYPDCPYFYTSCQCAFWKQKQRELFPEFHSGFPKNRGTDIQMPSLAKAHVLEPPLQAGVGFHM